MKTFGSEHFWLAGYLALGQIMPITTGLSLPPEGKSGSELDVMSAFMLGRPITESSAGSKRIRAQII